MEKSRLLTSNMLTFYTVAKLGFLRYWIEKDPLTIFLQIYICFVIANKEILRPCKTDVVGSSPTSSIARLVQLVEHVKKLFITFFTGHLFIWTGSKKRATSQKLKVRILRLALSGCQMAALGTRHLFLIFSSPFLFSIKFLTTNKLRGLYAL